MTRGRQVSRALGVVLTLSLAGCEDQTGALPVAPPPATPPPAPQPPRPAGEPALVTLMNGGTGVQVRVSDLFMVPADQLDSVGVEVRSENEAVATARLDGTGLTSLVVVEPVAEGDTSVVVTLRTSAGTAMQAIRVTVGPPAPQPPRPAGEPALVTLMNGGTGVQVRVSDLFMVPADQLDSVGVEVRSENEAVATARLDGTGLTSLVVVEPVAEGDTSVVVTLRTSAGTAMQAIRVTVGPPAAEPPRTVGRADALILVVGGKEAEWPVGDFFSVDPSQHDEVEVEAFSPDETIATVRAQGTGLMSVVFVRPTGAGTVLIEVIVRTSAGSATQLVQVTVGPAPTDAPLAVGEPESFTLVHGGSWRDFYLGHILTTGNRDWDRTAEVEVMPVDETVVAVHIEGRGLDATLFLAPVGPGETVIVVTARNAAGSAIQRIRAVVLPAEPPRLVGRLVPLILVAGAGGRPWFLDDHVFAPPGFLVEAESLDERVVIPITAKNLGGVYLEPVGPGETFVVVTARNAAGAAEVTGKVTVLEKVRVGLFVRGGSVAGPPIKLEEGGRWNLHIGLVDRDVEGAWAPSAAVKIGIATDAPPDQLRVPESVSNPSIGWFAEPILFTIEALADDVPGEPDTTYAISLTGIEGLPPWMELAKEAVRITIVDSPAAACEDLWVNALLDRPSGDERRGNFTIQAPHPDTSVSWAEPYVNRGFGLVWPTLATHVFPERLPFRELPDGFEQEVRLRWWDGDLRWTIQAPGCKPVELHCDEFTCDVR